MLSALFKISNSYSGTYKTLQILRYLRATYHLRENIEVMESLLLSFLTVLQGVFGGFNHHAKLQKNAILYHLTTPCKEFAHIKSRITTAKLWHQLVVYHSIHILPNDSF